MSDGYDMLRSGPEALPYAADWFEEAGRDNEFDAKLAVRWDAGGGDPAVRFASAAAGLREWRQVLRRCTFVCMDALRTLAKVEDVNENGIYCDPPWPDDGDDYKHKFNEARQAELAAVLTARRRSPIVLRFGDHPLIRWLYPVDLWRWHSAVGRTSANGKKREVFIERIRQ